MFLCLKELLASNCQFKLDLGIIETLYLKNVYLNKILLRRCYFEIIMR